MSKWSKGGEAESLCHSLKADGVGRLFLGHARASPSGETGLGHPSIWCFYNAGLSGDRYGTGGVADRSRRPDPLGDGSQSGC
jgi:hypothetical protein